MALDNITEDLKKDYQQKNQAITDNSLITLVAAVAGQRIKVIALVLSSDTAAEFSLNSGSNIIFNFHGGANWGTVNLPQGNTPLFYSNAGEALTIQCDQASLDANVYIKYVVEA